MLDDNASEDKRLQESLRQKNLGRNRNQRLLDGFQSDV